MTKSLIKIESIRDYRPLLLLPKTNCTFSSSFLLSSSSFSSLQRSCGSTASCEVWLQTQNVNHKKNFKQPVQDSEQNDKCKF